MARRTIQKVDGRTREAQFRRKMRGALAAHVGGTPSIAQEMLIDLAVDTAFEVEIMKSRRAELGSLSDHDHRHFLAYCNSYRRTLVALGVKQSAGGNSPLTLSAYLANKDDGE